MHQELFTTIKNEHTEVKNLLSDMKESSSGAVKTRDRLLEKLRSALTPHMRGEERGLYKLLQENNESRSIALESAEEHHISRIALHEIEELAPENEAWSAKLKVLSELLHHHMQEEEDEVFDQAREVLSQDQARQALEIFEDVKKSEQ